MGKFLVRLSDLNRPCLVRCSLSIARGALQHINKKKIGTATHGVHADGLGEHGGQTKERRTKAARAPAKERQCKAKSDGPGHLQT